MMRNRYVDVGFGNVVAAGRILYIADSDATSVKRDVTILRGVGRLRDFTRGRATRSLIYMDDGSAVQSSLYPEVIAIKAGG